MYYLEVYFPGEPAPRMIHGAEGSPKRAIVRVLAEHPGCERIEVISGAIRLFAVDARGERLPDGPRRAPPTAV